MLDIQNFSRHTVDKSGKSRFLYGGPYKSAERAESRLEDFFAEGSVSLGDRPDVVRRGGAWWLEIDG